jgi:germination protein YpeB
MIEKFEKKINKFKRKVNKKALGVAVFFVFGLVSVFSMEMSNNFKRQKQLAQDEYNKSMYEVVGYVKNIETELAKLQLTNTTKLTSTTLASIWKQSNLAKANLESLPVAQQSISDAAKYLSQVSDFSHSLMKQVVSDQKITEEEYVQISQIYEESKELSKVMEEIYVELNTGRIKWDEIQKAGNEKLPKLEISQEVSNIDKIGKTFQEYEGLIYDGAFSDHLLTQEPKNLADKEVSSEDAKNYINEFFGKDNIEYLNYIEESQGRLDLYYFDLKLKDESFVRNIYITKKECKLYLMISDKKQEEQKIQMEEAKEKGKEFLKRLGIDNVEDTYYLVVENMAIINYAAVQDDVIMYTDLVKVKVGLDDGNIYSVESQGYIFNHTKRENLTPKITLEKAQEVINENINIISKRLALIPTESKNEVLTYEFKGKIDDREFLIYVNATTAQEERILLILETPNGILTM